jgi:hypothetical protein
MSSAAIRFDTLAPARMNLYLLIAIAIGAISGTTEVSVARPGLASVAAECGVMRSEQSIASPRSTLHHARSESTAPRVIDGAPARIEAPLAGAATPRAPARNC